MRNLINRTPYGIHPKKSPAKKFPAIKSPKVTACAKKFPAKKSLINIHFVCVKWAKHILKLFISTFSSNAWTYILSTTSWHTHLSDSCLSSKLTIRWNRLENRMQLYGFQAKWVSNLDIKKIASIVYLKWFCNQGSLMYVIGTQWLINILWHKTKNKQLNNKNNGMHLRRSNWDSLTISLNHSALPVHYQYNCTNTYILRFIHL